MTEEKDGVSFDVVAPSIPSYGFSEKPTEKGFGIEKIAAHFHKFMTEELGYKKFAPHGGDWGSSITEQIALNFHDSLLGIHLTDIPFHHLFTVAPGDLTDAEKKCLEAGKKWQQTSGGYAAIQGTRPQTLAYGLNDSPAGLAAWIVDFFRSWCDCENGDVETCFSKDKLLTNITIYRGSETMPAMAKKGDEKKIETPTAAAIFPKDIVPALREFAERFFSVQR